ncbi:hypothetical protein [Kitasatospora sp. GAS204B]|uniref:hypothetical protein n=1 Tax=unclassified Kitasatospora TaxID=2633591 RepID=UPI00247350EA|nr:hypothetical protein [Kitasatospora sp. GAS204B]MDH6118110.1 hypothetical protein [Kitasatospora sp. GAS204B]
MSRLERADGSRVLLDPPPLTGSAVGRGRHTKMKEQPVSTIATIRQPGDSLARPYDHTAAEADLRLLGRHLDDQAKAGASTAMLDATLGVMRLVHTRIATESAVRRPKALRRLLVG